MSETLTKIASEIKRAESTQQTALKAAQIEREIRVTKWLKWLREELPVRVHDAILSNKSYVNVPSETDDFFDACKREGVIVNTSRGSGDTTLYSICIEDLKKSVGAL